MIAGAVVTMLLERIEGFEGAPRTVTITGELVRRSSVAPPPEK
jgi:DNA-binding LacI/PurR family transcriptional regulator